MSSELEGVTVHHIETSATTSTNGSTGNQEQIRVEQVAPKLGGYTEVAQFMCKAPTTAIFSSFKELSLTNLLRMQSELHWLEQRLERVRELDTNSDGGETHSLSFEEMEQNVTVRGKLLKEIDLKLERYHDALLRMARLGEVQNLSAKDHENLRVWLSSNDYFTASERTIWAPSRFDHVCLSKIEQRDIFFEMIYGIFISLHYRLWGQRKQRISSTVITEYDDGLIETLAGLLSISASSLLPTLAILVLYFVKPPLIRIALVCIITGAVSFLLSCFTKTKRMEIFSATAAFAAVMIVFVSNGTPNNGS